MGAELDQWICEALHFCLLVETFPLALRRENGDRSTHLYRIISNPIYIGRIPHRGQSYEGEHEAIIDAETWDKVQAQLTMNAGRKRGRVSSQHPSLLAGLLFTAEGVPFTPSHAVNHGRRYRYYVERSLLRAEADEKKPGAPQLKRSGNGIQTKGWRLPAHEIEQLVLKRVGTFLRDHELSLMPFPSDGNHQTSFLQCLPAHPSWLTRATRDHSQAIGSSLPPSCDALPSRKTR
jgi:Recombinase